MNTLKVRDFMPTREMIQAGKKPRPATSYRGARRNAAKVARQAAEKLTHANQQS